MDLLGLPHHVNGSARKHQARGGGQTALTGEICVGHTIWSLGDGGMERGLLNIVNRADQAEFSHVILCLGEAGPLANRVRSPNCRVVELKKTFGNDPRLPLRIAAWARHFRLDILHARGWPTLVETALAARVARVRRTVYGFHGKTMEELKGKSLRRRLVEMVFMRLYSRIVTLTDSMKADIADACHLDPARVLVIPNGVDIEVFRPHRDRRRLRAEFGLPVNGLIVGNVARLDPVKNHTILFRALSRLRCIGMEVFLLLIGDGPERARLEREIREAGLTPWVHLLGQTDRVSDLLNCMDIYVQPSFYEGFSNTVLEAMACGLPVVAARTGGTVDLLRAGENGYLFDPRDDEGLSMLLLALKDKARRQTMGMHARKQAIERFRLTTMTQGYEQMYRDLVSLAPADLGAGCAWSQRPSV